VTYRGGAARCCAFIYWLSHSILEVVLPHGISSSQGKKVVQGKECPVTVIVIIIAMHKNRVIIMFMSSGNLIFVNTPPQIAIWTANMVVSSNALVAGLALVTYRGGAARCCAFIYWLSHSILKVVLPHGTSSSQ